MAIWGAAVDLCVALLNIKYWIMRTADARNNSPALTHTQYLGRSLSAAAGAVGPRRPPCGWAIEANPFDGAAVDLCGLRERVRHRIVPTDRTDNAYSMPKLPALTSGALPRRPGRRRRRLPSRGRRRPTPSIAHLSTCVGWEGALLLEMPTGNTQSTQASTAHL